MCYDDFDVLFELGQHVGLEFYRDRSLTQQSTEGQVAPHLILILSQLMLLLLPPIYQFYSLWFDSTGARP